MWWGLESQGARLVSPCLYKGHRESVLPYLGEGHSEGEKTVGVEIFHNFPRMHLVRVGSGGHCRQPTVSHVGDLG